MITGEQVAAKANSLLSMGMIPYVNNGSNTKGMDCQGLIEWALRESGFACNYRGTNDMWRNMLSEKGAIEQCVSRWGKVPLGALIFIHDNDGGEPASYQGDGEGNAWHVYIKVADGLLVHASAGNKCVTTRDFADKTIGNGGPNAYGLVDGIVYTGTKQPEGVADAGSASGAGAADAEDMPTSTPQKPKWRPQYTHLIWRKGDKGNGPREVQEGLRRAGADISVDGEFGPATEAAVIAFQSANGLEADGVVGKLTWAALVAAANA